MQEDKHDIRNLLTDERFVDWVLNSNSESNHYWEKWMDSHPERRREVEWARQFIKSTRYEESFQLKDEEYSSMLQHVVKHSRQRERIGSGINSWKLKGIAASILLVLSVSVIFFLRPSLKDDNQGVNAISTVVKKTGYGQKRKIMLPDGTTIMLNAGSELSYNLPFDADQRRVSFSGEAFFEVARDPDRPFIIKSREVETKVLGTSFNLKSYPFEGTTSVSVVEGKVQVTDVNGGQVILKPREKAFYNSVDQLLTVSTFDLEEITNWREGIISFNNTSFEEVFTTLERWYGVEFFISDDAPISGSYTGAYKNASLEKVLDGVSYTSGFSYEIKDRQVIIKGENYDTSDPLR